MTRFPASLDKCDEVVYTIVDDTYRFEIYYVGQSETRPFQKVKRLSI